jgi:hypothetical protein
LLSFHPGVTQQNAFDPSGRSLLNLRMSCWKTRSLCGLFPPQFFKFPAGFLPHRSGLKAAITGKSKEYIQIAFLVSDINSSSTGQVVD